MRVILWTSACATALALCGLEWTFPRVVMAQRAPATAVAKPASAEHMFFDTHRGQLMLLEMTDESQTLRTWTLDGREWRAIAGSAPPARELSAVAYDEGRQRLVLYGGSLNELRRNDLWEWDGTIWQQRTTDGTPGARDHHSLVFDEARSRIVLFSGLNAAGGPERDTWTWDGKTWAQVATTGPMGRGHAPMVWDSVRQRAVLFGGISDRGHHADTWAWDGTSWQKIADRGPSPRYRHRMAFHREARTIVLFGGLGRGRSSLGDTWVWDGAAWTEAKVAGPPPRNSHVMAYDPVRRRVVLFGGSNFENGVDTNYDDFWEWDGQKWTRIG